MRKLALALAFITSSSFAEISVTPGAAILSVNYDNGLFDYSASGEAFDLTIASDNGYYFNAEISSDGDDTLSRETTTLTAGKNFSDLGIVGFVGLRNSSIVGPAATSQAPEVNFEINGAFIGASKRFMIGNSSAFSLSTAAGTMTADATFTDQQNSEETESASALGYSLGAAYSYWFSNGWALTGGAKYQNYAFDIEGSDGESISLTYGKISYRF